MFVFWGCYTPGKTNEHSPKKGPGLQREIHLNLPTLNIAQIGVNIPLRGAFGRYKPTFVGGVGF